MRLFAFLLMAFTMMAAPRAQAASAVAYGVQTVHSIENIPMREQAVQVILETCSKADKSCKILIKCQTPGFGAVALERISGLLQSVGGSCGMETQEAADKKAMDSCNDNKQDECKIKAKWQDKGAE